MNFADAFKAAGAPLGTPRNQWSALEPDGKFIAVTVWAHEYDDSRCRGSTPILGRPHPKAQRYFYNTPEYLKEWANNREAADRAAPDSAYGWKLLKEHHQRAFAEKLPVRIVVIQAKGSADGSSRSNVKDARYRSDWEAELNYFDPVTGAYEYAIWLV